MHQWVAVFGAHFALTCAIGVMMHFHIEYPDKHQSLLRVGILRLDNLQNVDGKNEFSKCNHGDSVSGY